MQEINVLEDLKRVLQDEIANKMIFEDDYIIIYLKKNAYKISTKTLACQISFLQKII